MMMLMPKLGVVLETKLGTHVLSSCGRWRFVPGFLARDFLTLQRHLFAGTRICADFTDYADWFKAPQHPRNP